MPVAIRFAVFLVAAFGFAVVVWPLLRRPHACWWHRFVICAPVLFTPLLAAAQSTGIRALACVLAVELFFKTTDYAGRWSSIPENRQQFGCWLRFLIPFPVLQVCFRPRAQEMHGRTTGLSGPGCGLMVFMLCIVLVEYLANAAMLQSSFLLDHTLKFFVFVVAIESLSQLLHEMEQLAGCHFRPLIDSAFRSLTVGEFWVRYNTRVHAWFEDNVFRSLRGERSLQLAVVATFLVSGVLHELGFAIATQRFDGYQLAFFMLQVPAVLLGHRLRRRAVTSIAGRLMLRASTITWMWATSMLFFYGVDRVFPFFYASTPWLP